MLFLVTVTLVRAGRAEWLRSCEREEELKLLVDEGEVRSSKMLEKIEPDSGWPPRTLVRRYYCTHRCFRGTPQKPLLVCRLQMEPALWAQCVGGPIGHQL